MIGILRYLGIVLCATGIGIPVGALMLVAAWLMSKEKK